MLVVLTDIFPSTWFAVVPSTSMHAEKFRSTISTIASPHFVRASHVLFTLSVDVFRVKPRDRVVVRRRGVQKGFDIHDTKHVCSFPASGLKVSKLFFIFFSFFNFHYGLPESEFRTLKMGSVFGKQASESKIKSMRRVKRDFHLSPDSPPLSPRTLREMSDTTGWFGTTADLSLSDRPGYCTPEIAD